MDAVEDTRKHIARVNQLLLAFALALEERGKNHDASKLESPEREMFEIWRPRLDALSIDSSEYTDALAQMGQVLKHHYLLNRHHPEHFGRGLYEMTLVDVVEMVCDWMAAAERKGETVNMEWASRRFGIDSYSPLFSIIQNTLNELKDDSTKS